MMKIVNQASITGIAGSATATAERRLPSRFPRRRHRINWLQQGASGSLLRKKTTYATKGRLLTRHELLHHTGSGRSARRWGNWTTGSVMSDR